MRPIRLLFALGAAFAAQRVLRPYMPRIMRVLKGLPTAVTSAPPTISRRRTRDEFVMPASPAVVMPQEQPEWIDDRDVDATGTLDPFAPNATAHPR